MRPIVHSPLHVAVLSLASALLVAAGGSARADGPPPASPLMKYTASWFGNSLNNVTPITNNGKPDFYYEYVQKDGNALAVGPDGTCYVCSGWDETQRGIGFYKNGHDAGRCAGISSAGASIAVDDKFVYTSQSNTILRWNLNGSQAPIPNAPKDIAGYVGGLLAADHKVFVGAPGTNTVTVYDRDTFKQLLRFPVHSPWRMTMDNDGKLWIINRKDSDQKGGWYTSEDPTSTAQVSQYDPATGKPTGKNIDNMTGATSVTITPDNTLLVAGPNSQVLEFNISGAQPVQSGALGVKGGVYSDPAGTMGPDRLFGLWGVGCDKAGNIYTLAHLPNAGTGIDLRSFTRDGSKMNWQLYNVEFTGVCGADPASDGLDVYTSATHFRLDPTKPPGQQAEWKGYTLNPAYDDGRFTQGWNSPMMRRLQGRLYMYLQPGSFIGIFRQGPGDSLFLPDWSTWPRVGSTAPRPATMPMTSTGRRSGRKSRARRRRIAWRGGTKTGTESSRMWS